MPEINSGLGANINFSQIEQITEDEVKAEATTPTDDVTSVLEKISEEESRTETVPEEEVIKELDAPEDENQFSKPGLEDEVAEEENEGENEVPKTSKSEKTYQAQVGDKKSSLPDNAVITIPVNGKDTQVLIKDLVKDFNGRTEYGRRFHELAEEKKKINGFLNEFLGCVKEGRAIEAMNKVIGKAGLDALQFRRALRASLIPEVEQYMQLSPEERKYLELEEENEYRKSQLESVRSQEFSNKQISDAEKEIQRVAGIYKIPDYETFGELFKELEQERVAGKLDHPSVTPELVGQYYRFIQNGALLDKAIEKTNPALKQNAEVKNYLLQQMRILTDEGEEVSIEDLVDIIDGAFGSEKARQNLSEKITQSTPRLKQTSKTQKLNEDDPGLNWDLV